MSCRHMNTMDHGQEPQGPPGDSSQALFGTAQKIRTNATTKIGPGSGNRQVSRNPSLVVPRVPMMRTGKRNWAATQADSTWRWAHSPLVTSRRRADYSKSCDHFLLQVPAKLQKKRQLGDEERELTWRANNNSGKKEKMAKPAKRVKLPLLRERKSSGRSGPAQGWL